MLFFAAGTVLIPIFSAASSSRGCSRSSSGRSSRNFSGVSIGSSPECIPCSQKFFCKYLQKFSQKILLDYYKSSFKNCFESFEFHPKFRSGILPAVQNFQKTFQKFFQNVVPGISQKFLQELYWNFSRKFLGLIIFLQELLNNILWKFFWKLPEFDLETSLNFFSNSSSATVEIFPDDLFLFFE